MISNGRAGSSPARGTLIKWEVESGKWEVKAIKSVVESTSKIHDLVQMKVGNTNLTR